MLLKSDSEEKIIVALDGMSPSSVYSLIDKLPDLRWVKVGLELFVRTGPEILRELQERNLKVFLDLKFHDIPATMAASCREAAKTGVNLISVHACAGHKALRESLLAASQGAQEAGLSVPPKLLAVTILTSWSQSSFNRDLVIQDTLVSRVRLLANLAHKAGLQGCVCSPCELKELRKIFPEDFELITPGIRSIVDKPLDQERFMSPYSALLAGATRLVIGRPITRANNPSEEFKRICREISTSN